MTGQTDTLASAPSVSEEDQARADFYALIARLFYTGPDAALLAAIAATGAVAGTDPAAPLPAAWGALSAAAATTDPEQAQLEYDNVFVGTGKAEITPYATHYLPESKKENVLVRLRSELAELGLARAQGVNEYEDHLSSLCEVMRHLIFFAPDVALQKQKSFFLMYLVPCYANVCAAVTASPNTNFYKHVARFAQAFLDVEAESYELSK